MWPDSKVLYCLTMKLKALGAFETLATTHPSTQCHLPEGLNFQQHCCENLKSHKNTLLGFHISLQTPSASSHLHHSCII